MPQNCGNIPQMLVLTASIILFLLAPGSKVEGYEDYEDINEEDGEDDYANYDVVDADEPALISTITKEDEEAKSSRIRRDQDDEEDNDNRIRDEEDGPEVVDHKSRGEDEEVANTKATLSPEEFADIKGALNKLLLGIATENPFNPHSTTPTIDYRPSIELNVSSITPSYNIEETSTQSEELTNFSSEEDNLTSIFNLASEEYNQEDWPTRSSKIAYKIKSHLDRLSSIKTLREGEQFLRGSSNNTNVTTSTARTPQIDIAKLLAIISDLAKGFESNLTRKLNESIVKMSIPTCTTPTEPTITEMTTVTDEYDANYTGAIVAKCFVCGLDTPGIPEHAHCADAFAGDFLPLVPVDTSAKGKLSRFRKYCKYANVQGYRTKPSQPRVIIGRWTGGCSVRWIDLSGVYTQRSCRNRMAPTMGLHFASKRMAKLEKALWNIENGCIISPVATLTPLSRGISLYARFHACVCTGSWCNSARVNAPYYWILCNAILTVTCFSTSSVTCNFSKPI